MLANGDMDLFSAEEVRRRHCCEILCMWAAASVPEDVSLDLLQTHANDSVFDGACGLV